MPYEQISSPGRLDAIMKTLHSSPRPLFPAESRTSPVSQGFPTCSENTLDEKAANDEAVKPKPADFSSLEFGDVAESKESSTSNEQEEIHSVPPAAEFDDTKSPSSLPTFGYQQRMNFNMYQGFNSLQQKPKSNKKKKKKWNQNQNFCQQPERNVQGSGNYTNTNFQPNFGQQQGMAAWRGSSQGIQNVPQSFQGNQVFCGGSLGLVQGPSPQNMVPGNLAGNISQQASSFPNFSVPPPNIPPLEFFRKIPPPNFPPQNQPVVMPQLPQNPLIPQQTVPLPHLQPNQPTFFPASQQAPYNRLPPPPPPFQASLPVQPSSQFPQNSSMPQLPQGTQSGFPSQQSQFPALNSSSVSHVGLIPVKQISPQEEVSLITQHQSSTPEATSASEVESLALQTGAVTTSSLETCELRGEAERHTPLHVKRNPSHLPPHWKSATDPQGKVYYYHTQTR